MSSSTISRGIKQLVSTVRQREGAGFIVRRALGGQQLPSLTPFLMLDHFGPVTAGPGELTLAPDHPHRGFETVTYILQGEVTHKDSHGNEGTITSGAVQWMTAGSGVVHSEMPSDALQKTGGTMEGFQLWVNLPAKHKMTTPRYQDLTPDTFPTVTLDDDSVVVKILAGEVQGKKAIIDTFTPIIFLDVHLKKNEAKFTHMIPAEYNGLIYVYRGEGVFGSTKTAAKEGQVLELDKGNEITMTSSGDEECKILLIAGEPINEPVARYGPFVMNTQQEIQQAFMDYQSGHFGEIAGGEERHHAAREALKKSGGPIHPTTKH